jgi:hypothetical protein
MPGVHSRFCFFAMLVIPTLKRPLLMVRVQVGPAHVQAPHPLDPLLPWQNYSTGAVAGVSLPQAYTDLDPTPGLILLR